MLARVETAAIFGVDAYPVTVEVDITRGQFAFNTVGLPDAAVQEAKERVRAAITNSGFLFPQSDRITVNLAPADIRKEGPAFDLPIALGILAATEQIRVDALERYLLVGELSLDGSVRPVAGALPVAICGKERDKQALLVPSINGPEAAVVEDFDVYGVETLYQTVELLENDLITGKPVQVPPEELDLTSAPYGLDFSDVKGQDHVKRALEVAAAGGHNAIMVGPPGSGKTMLARRLPTIMPPLTLAEALEVTKLYSVSGNLPGKTALVRTRPFRSPHHTVSNAGLVGGGAIPRPGEVSLAHHGVLFLDELPEFNRDVLEVMRQPLEDGTVTISRAATSLTFPADFMLMGAMNPCPCGYHTDPVKQCTCNVHQIRRYLMRISGPLLDRIDIHIEVPRLDHEDLMRREPGESSTVVRERVMAARGRQTQRFARAPFYCNRQMTSKALREFCPLSSDVEALLRQAIQQFGLSARAYDRILKLSRTIADLEGADDIAVHHAAEAIQYRSLDRKLWG
jgi:magnesium chelatase family protein